jgi:low temperature requirement protein LtrA
LRHGVKDKVVVITEASERRSAILDGARPTSEDDTATTFELFFDLVYVFAMTQVTANMLHAHDALVVLQGLLVLALLWWTWSAYAWLGNQARADTGVVRAAMAVAMVALFVVALTLPAAAFLPPLVGLAGLVLLLGVLIGVETRRYAVLRAGARPG